MNSCIYIFIERRLKRKLLIFKLKKEKKKKREGEISIFKLSIKRNKYNLIPFPVFLHVTIIKADNITN